MHVDLGVLGGVVRRAKTEAADFVLAAVVVGDVERVSWSRLRRELGEEQLFAKVVREQAGVLIEIDVRRWNAALEDDGAVAVLAILFVRTKDLHAIADDRAADGHARLEAPVIRFRIAALLRELVLLHQRLVLILDEAFAGP